MKSFLVKNTAFCRRVSNIFPNKHIFIFYLQVSCRIFCAFIHFDHLAFTGILAGYDNHSEFWIWKSQHAVVHVFSLMDIRGNWNEMHIQENCFNVSNKLIVIVYKKQAVKINSMLFLLGKIK